MRYLSWIVALLLAGAGLCHADELGQQVREDLAPLDGRIIAVRADDYLIDQDATNGVRDGDLFAVIQPGQSVRDPKTGKVLGHEEAVSAVLRVTQVMRGFSKAVAMGRTGTVRQGDAIRRYALLQTVFWDYTQRGESVYTELRDALPDLHWKDYGAAQSSRPKEPAFSGAEEDLFFILKTATLEVRDGRGSLIKAYDKKPDVMPVSGGGTPAPLSGSEIIGTLPMAVSFADVVPDGDRNLMVATDEKYIRVYAVGADAALRASWSPDTADRIMTVRWWRPKRKGASFYLAATLWTEQGFQGARGVILRWQDNTLSLVKTVVNSVLGTFDRDGDGIPEILLKQEFDQEYFFGRRVKILRWSGDDLSAEPLDEKLPKGFTVTGSLLADLDGDGKIEAALIKNGYLFIYRGRKQFYKSPRNIGGSINTLVYNATPGMEDFRMETVRFELSPLWCDLDGDGRKELVVPAAEGVNRILSGLPAKVDRSWLAVVRHEQGRFITKQLSESFERPIQGLGHSSQGVLFLTSQSTDDQGGHGQAIVHRLSVRPTS